MCGQKDLQLDRNELLNLLDLVVNRCGGIETRDGNVVGIRRRLPSWWFGVNRLEFRSHVRAE